MGGISPPPCPSPIQGEGASRDDQRRQDEAVFALAAIWLADAQPLPAGRVIQAYFQDVFAWGRIGVKRQEVR